MAAVTIAATGGWAAGTFAFFGAAFLAGAASDMFLVEVSWFQSERNAGMTLQTNAPVFECLARTSEEASYAR